MQIGLGLSLSLSPILGGTIGSGLVDGDPATQALLARMSAQPSSARAAQIDALIVALKTAGVWDLLDVFYILAAHDAQAARLNWKAVSLNLTAVNTPTFTTDRGYAGDGSTSYLDTGYNPASASVGMALNDAHIGVYARNNTTDADFDMQGTLGTNLGVRARNLTASQIRVCSGTSTAFATGGNAPHHIMGIRRDASNQLGFRNGAQDVTAAVASTALPGNITILGNGSIFSDRQMAAAHVGRALSDPQALALSNAIQTYMTAVGA